MAQGVIKSITPHMVGGVHRSWENKYTGKPNYGFIIVFEDGVTGSCASEKNTYPLSPGTAVTYEVAVSGNGTNIITKVKRLEMNVAGATKSFTDPATIKRIAFSMCQSIARIHYTNVGVSPRGVEDINTLAGYYSQWVLSNLQEDDIHYRDIVSRRYYALQLAVECIPFADMGIKEVEQVITSAEGFLQPIYQISHATRS